MGVRTLPALSARLIEAGRQAGEPAAVVAQGTLPQQRTVLGTLGTIAEQAASAGLEAPAITVIGAVAALHGELDWRLPGPLAGVTVAVTRARAQASSLAAQSARARRKGDRGSGDPGRAERTTSCRRWANSTWSA